MAKEYRQREPLNYENSAYNSLVLHRALKLVEIDDLKKDIKKIERKIDHLDKMG